MRTPCWRPPSVGWPSPGCRHRSWRKWPSSKPRLPSVSRAFADGALTCRALVQGYLARIEAYDKRGPALTALITVNPQALATAEAMDAAYRQDRAKVGPLHCVPVVLKDNFDTADMPTTGGSRALAGSQPSRDAFTVKKLRDAGALILAKANLQELAMGGHTVSSLGGQTRNPYDLTRTPGGSSGGTGAAIAAGFALVGTGSDTGQSIRSPASANNLVGLRPTRGLVSRGGIIPVSATQDEARANHADGGRCGADARRDGRLRPRGSGDRRRGRPRAAHLHRVPRHERPAQCPDRHPARVPSAAAAAHARGQPRHGAGDRGAARAGRAGRGRGDSTDWPSSLPT